MMKDHAFAEINVRQLDVVQNGQVTKTRTHINLLQTSEFYSNYLVCRISTHKFAALLLWSNRGQSNEKSSTRFVFSHFMLKNRRRTIAEKSHVLRMLESGKRSPYCTLPGVKLDERSCGGYPISVSSFRINNTSVIPLVIPRNSASAFERATTFCFLLRHVTRFPQTKSKIEILDHKHAEGTAKNSQDNKVLRLEGCVLSQDCCGLSQDCCVLFQDTLRFVSKPVAICLKTVAGCLQTRCVLSKDSLRFVSKLTAPNGKMIVDSIENGPYVRRMLATPGEPDLYVSVPESFHEQTDEELTKTDIKRMDADDQAIQTILLALPEEVYAAVDSYETAKEIWERVRSDIGELEKKAKLFNEWEKFTSTDGESIKSYYHRFMQLMNDLKRNKHFPENIASNLNFLNNLQPEWKRHVTIEEVNELRAEHLVKSHDPLALMDHSQNSFNFPTTHEDQSSSSTHPQQSFPINNTYNPHPSVNQNFRQPQCWRKWWELGWTWKSNGLVVVPRIANQSGTGNVVAARAEGTGIGNQPRCYNCRGLGHITRNCTARPKRRDAAYLQTQLLIAQKEEARIQLQAEEFNFMAAAGDLDEIEEVNANCILMASLQQASTSGTQHDRAPVYDIDGSAENDNHVTSVAPRIVQSGGTVETSPAPNEEIRAHQETVYHNLVDQVAQVDMINRNMRATNAELKYKLARYKIQEQRVEIKKSSISSLMEEKKKLKHDFKIREDKFLNKEVDLEATIKDLENMLLKRDQTIQTMHMLNPKPDSFYHPNQKMALGYPSPSYLKKAQLKQQSLYNGNLLSEVHDPPAVYDSEETLELAQESREKMRLLKKEIKPANYAKINHLSGVFVPQTSKSKEELFLSNVSNMVTVSKTISIPNEDLLDDTTLSVARKFLNEVKSSLVTFQHVVKQKMTLEVQNWSSSAHKEVHRIISHETAPIINQVDARVQNFEIQFLQEAAKFVRDFKSLANEADESLDKQKSLELEIERLLKASISHDIMSIVQNSFVDVSSDLRTELDQCKYDKISYDKAYNDMQQKVEQLQAQLRDLKGKSSDTPSVSNTLDPLNQKLESKIAELEFQVVNYKREISHLKTTYKNLFDSIKSNRAHAKLHDLIFENAKLRAWLFEKTYESVKNTSGKSMTSHGDKPKLNDVTPLSKKLHASMPSHSVPQPIEFNVVKNRNVVQICLWCINSGCSKHMTGNIKLLINFVWKFLGTVRFENDHIAAILGYGDLKWGNITITRVYFVEGLGRNLFSVGQFCDADLEVAFRRNTCFIRDLNGVDLLKGNRSTNLYTINLYDIASASPICLMARATPTKSWLWHQRLSHLNFDTINDLARNDLRLHLLYMDLCGPMRVASINGKRYVLVIVDDYSRYTWVHFLRTKDETPEVINNFLKKISVRLQAPVIIVRTDNGTEFNNQVLKEYFDSVGITHETSAAKTPQQNGVVERKNHTLVEAARTMLIFSHAPLFLWAEAIATACYTQNRSIIHRRFNKTPYELIHSRKPDISYLHVFGALCYLKNDREDIGKLGAKGDIGFFIGYSANLVAYRVYNQRTRKIMETMNVTFDELHYIMNILVVDRQKALYGLKQAPRVWYDELSTFLLQNGFSKGTIDPTLFTRRFDDDILVVQVYVDDIIFGSTDPRYATLFFDLMKSQFEMSMMGEMTFFLGLQVNQSPSGIFINQSKYVQDILMKYGLNTSDIVGTPMDIKDKLDLDQIGTSVDATKYRSMIGALMYLTSNRPDIVQATCYTKDSGFELTGFSDTDYAGCKDTFKSTSEYVSLSACCARILWMRTQLTDYGYHFDKIPIYCDSKSAIAISCNPVQHSRMKHIAVRYHFIKEHVEKGTIELYFVKTDYQLADIFTKALPVDRFNYLVCRLGMCSLCPQELDRLAKLQ
uniref:Retrovirus-related Pol polyprotein from transposon TNT 1-94 n=1 Tax=Tanacetum cinerariifolium TaxID=118510 RepID=A0A6L2LL66_TANCI|nr:retrovirus-related Pol polyprotein from transposon TNT 1-94 [Tanacetum cinerariifolium]